MAGTPLFTLVLSHFVVADDRLSWPKIAGVVFGVVGVVILIGPSALAGLGGHVVREVAILMAGFCFAANSVIAKLLSGEEPYALSASIFMVGAALSVPFALIMEAPFQIAPSTASTIAVLLLGLLPTGLATLFMLALLRRTGPSFFSQINFLVPIFGVAWAMAVLGERPGANAWIALVLVLAGVAIARRAPGPRPAVKLPSETISP